MYNGSKFVISDDPFYASSINDGTQEYSKVANSTFFSKYAIGSYFTDTNRYNESQEIVNNKTING
jgi:hypothetical protein